MNMQTIFIIGALFLASSSVFSETALAEKKQLPFPSSREINPNAGFCVTDAINYDLSADFLYWRPSTFRFPFAVNGIAVTEVEKEGQIYLPEFQFAPGFKVGASLYFSHDGWDLTAGYSWLHFTANKHFSPTDGTGAQASVQFSQATIDALLSADSKVQATFNLGHLQLGRDFYTSPHLSLRPNIGMSFIYFPYKQKITYDFITEDIHKFETHKDFVQTFGVGPRIGIDSAWHFTKYFSLIGNYYFAPLWSRFRISTKETNQNLETTAQITNLYLKDHLNFIQPLSELFLGFQWERYFAHNTYRLNFHAGCEMVLGLTTAVHAEEGFLFQGQFNMYGLTLGSKFDF